MLLQSGFFPDYEILMGMCNAAWVYGMQSATIFSISLSSTDSGAMGVGHGAENEQRHIRKMGL